MTALFQMYPFFVHYHFVRAVNVTRKLTHAFFTNSYDMLRVFYAFAD